MDSIPMVGPQGLAKTRPHQEDPSYTMLAINVCNLGEHRVRLQAPPQLWVVAAMSLPRKCREDRSHPMDGRLTTRVMLLQEVPQMQAVVEAVMRSMRPLLQPAIWMCTCAARCQAVITRSVPQRRVPYLSGRRPWLSSRAT